MICGLIFNRHEWKTKELEENIRLQTTDYMSVKTRICLNCGEIQKELYGYGVDSFDWVIIKKGEE